GTHVRLRDELVALGIGGLTLPRELDVVVHADEVVDIRRVLVIQRNLTGGLLRRIPGGDLPVLLGEGLTLVLGLLRDDLRRLADLQLRTRVREVEPVGCADKIAVSGAGIL
ncbi:hypothetical protein, partial [Corynebacterium variabile]|uniref:hypothetical protein n=1 Tax=Corynebacterium variabile TaxID=1727 RepID=UPI001DAFE63E